MSKKRISTVNNDEELSSFAKNNKKVSDKRIAENKYYTSDVKPSFTDVEQNTLTSNYSPVLTSTFDPYEDYVNDRTLRGGQYTFSELNDIRANNQYNWEQAGNAIKRVGTNIIPQIMSGAASMLDIPGYWDAEHAAQNEIVNWANSVQEWSQEAMPIYEENPNASMQMQDWAWWMSRGEGLVTSIGSFLALGAGVGKVVPWALKAARAQKLVKAISSAKVAKGVIGGAETLMTATMLNQAEAVMEATDVYNTTYENAINTTGISEKEARSKAATAASTTMNLNRINILLNLTSAKAFLRPRSFSNRLIQNPTLGKTFKELALEGGQEAMEELINHVASKAGLAAGKDEDYSFNDAMNDMGTMEGFEAAFLGALGGIAQTGGTKILQNIKGGVGSTTDADGNKISYATDQKNKYNKQQKAIETLTKEGVNITDAMKSIKDRIIFEEKLKEAIINGDQAAYDTLKDEMFENQAFTAFSTGISSILEDLYKEESRKNVDEVGQEHIDNAKKALKDLKQLEDVYNNYEELENVNEVFFNRANNIRTSRQAAIYEAEKFENDNKLSEVRKNLANKYRISKKRDVLITKNGEKSTETFYDDAPLTFDSSNIEVNPYESTENKATYDKFLKELQATKEYKESLNNEIIKEATDAALNKISTEFEKITSKKYQATVKAENEKKAIVKEYTEKLKESTSISEINNMIAETKDEAFIKKAYAKIKQLKTENQKNKIQEKKDAIETKFANKINNADSTEKLEALKKKIENQDVSKISQKAIARLKDKIIDQAGKLERGETIGNNDGLSAFTPGDPTSDEFDSTTSNLSKEIPNNKTEKSDVEKEVGDAINDVSTGDTELSIDIDENGNLVYNYEKSDTGSNKFAFTSREFDQSEEAGIVNREEFTDDVDNVHLLDPNKFTKGTKIVLEVEEDYEGEVFDPTSSTREKVLWQDRLKEIIAKYTIDTYKNSPEYRAEVPIVIKTKGGEYVAYVHDTAWIRSENIDNTQEGIAEDKAALEAIRNKVIEKGKVNTQITYKSFGRLIRNHTGKSMSVAEAMPDPNLKLAIGKDGAYNFQAGTNKVDKDNIINNNKPKDGRLYIIVQIGPKERLAIPLERTMLGKEAIDSVMKAVEIYMTKDTTNPIVKKILESNLGVDITETKGIRKYLSQFIHIVNTKGEDGLDSMLSNYAEGNSSIPLLTVTGSGIEFGRPGVDMTSAPKGKSAAVISPNFNKNQPESNRKSLLQLEEILKKMLVNADKETLTLASAGVAVLINDDNEVVSETYSEYLKKSYQTKLISVNIGTEAEPKWGYTIQPSITFDDAFAKGKKVSKIANKPNTPLEKKESLDPLQQTKPAKQTSEVETEIDVENEISEEVSSMLLAKNSTISELEEQLTSPDITEKGKKLVNGALELLRDIKSTTINNKDIIIDGTTTDSAEMTDDDLDALNDLNDEDENESDDLVPNYLNKDQLAEGQTQEDRDAQIKAQKRAINKNLIIGLDPRTQQSTITYLSSVIINAGIEAKKKNKKGKINTKQILKKELDALSKTAQFYKDNGLVNTAAKIEAVVKQFSKVSRLVNQNLSLLNTGIVQELPTTEQEDESGLGDVIHSDEWKYTIDSKNNASAEFKKFFSAIQAVNEKGPVVNLIGLPEMINFDELYNELHRILANKPSDFKLLIKILKVHAKKNLSLKSVIDKLENASQKIKNEFTSDMTKHNINMSFVMWSRDGKGNYTLQNWSSNASSIENKLRTIWNSNLKGTFTQSNLVTVNNDKEYIVNREVANNLINQATEWKNNPNDISFNDLAIWLGNFGIVVSDETYKDLKNGKFKAKGKSKTWIELFTHSNGLVNVIAKQLKGTVDSVKNDKDILLDNFKIITDTVIKELAKIEATNNKSITSNSFQAGGKTIYSYGNNNSLINRMRDITSYNEDGTFVNADIIADLRKISFSKYSLWLDDITDEESKDLAREHFSVGYLSLEALKKQYTDSKDNRKLNNLTAAEHEVTKLGLFFNNSKTILNNSVRRKVSFFYPTMSDKTTMLTIQALSHELNLEGGEISKKNIDTLYDSLVKPEIARITSNNQATNVKGYKPNYFYLLESLNFLEIEFNGETRNLLDILADNPDNINKGEVESDIKEHLNDIIEKLTNKKLEDWDKLNIGLNNKDEKNSFLDKEYMKNVAKGTNPVKWAAMDYVFNSLIANAEAHKLFIGDPAQYAKFTSKENRVDSLLKEGLTEEAALVAEMDSNQILKLNLEDTFINLGKRLAGDIAPGLELADSSNNKYYQVFFNDKKLNSSNVDDSVRLKYFSRIMKDFKKNYSNIEGADAQEYTTWKEHLYVLMQLGRLSEKNYNDFTDKINSQNKNGITESNKLSHEELGMVLQPMKPVYVGNILSVEQNIDKRLYIKSSSFPLIPQLTTELEIDKIRIALEKFETKESKNAGNGQSNITVRASFGTATKVGAIESSIDVFDNNGNVLDNLEITTDNALFIPRTNFRIQQDVPYDRSKSSVNIGTQARKLLFSDILDLQIEPGVTGEQLKKEYDNYYHELFGNAQEKLAEKLGLLTYDEDGNPVSRKSIPIEKLQEILIEEVKTRQGYPRNMLDSLELNEEGTDFKIPLWSSPYSTKFESILTSIVSKKVIKQKFPGQSGVLGSEEGFRRKEGAEADAELAKSGVVFSSNYDAAKGLQPLRPEYDAKGKLTGKMLPAQIMLPFKIRDEKGQILNINDFITDGKLDFKKIPQKVLTLFGFRIPNQAKSSMAAIEVVGFLPEASGDLLLTPRDWVAQMGSDFDVDKLYTYMYNTHYTNGKLSTTFLKSKKVIDGKIKEVVETILDIKKDLGFNKEERDLLESFENSDIYEKEVSDFIADLFKNLNNTVQKEYNDAVAELKMLKRSYVAHRQNAIIDIHIKIMTSNNPEIIAMNMDIDSFGEFKNIADKVNKIRKDNGELEERVTILSDAYQRNKFINATSGKNGVGAFSLDSSFVTITQGKELTILNLSEEDTKFLFKKGAKPSQSSILTYNNNIATFGNITSKGDLSNKYTLRSQQIIQNAKIAKRELTKDEKSSLKLKSNIVKSLQSTAVDNEKAQILDKLNINNETFDAIRAMVSLGFEETEISGLITQPIIWEYIEELTNSRSSLAPFVQDVESVIYDNLLLKYDKSNRLVNEHDLSHLENQSGEELLENLKSKLVISKNTTSDFNIKQLLLVEKFRNLTEIGKEIKKIQSAVNTEAKGLPTSLTENNFKVKQVNNLSNHSIYNADKLMGEYDKNGLVTPTTINGFAAKYGAMFANTIYEKYFPYQQLGVSLVNQEIQNHIPRGSDLSSVKQMEIFNKIFKGIRSFMFNNTNTNLMTYDPNIERNRLFVDVPGTNLSLATILNQLSGEQWYRENNFLNKLEPDPKIDGTISRINFDAATAENYDESNIYDGFLYLLKSESKIGVFNGIDYTMRMLAQELILAAYLEGGNQGAKQYLKYIPVVYLQNMNFGKSLSESSLSFTNTFNGHLDENGEPSYSIPSGFTKQFFQNNPDLLRTIKIDEIDSKEDIPSSFTIKDTKKSMYTYEEFDTVSPIKFLSIKLSRSKAGFAIYEYNDETNKYEMIPMLKGEYGFVQYNSQSFDNNNSIVHPAHKKSPIKVTPVEKFTPNIINNENDKAVNKIKITTKETGNKAFKSLMNKLITNDNVNSYNRELLDMLNQIEGNDKLELNFINEVNAGVAQYVNGKITLNLNKKSGLGVALDNSNNSIIASAFAHETIHGYTSDLIYKYEEGNLDQLTKAQITIIENLKNLQKQYIDALIKKEGKDGIDSWTRKYWTWKWRKDNVDGSDKVLNVDEQTSLANYLDKHNLDIGINLPSVDFSDSKNLSKYYGTVKLQEFVTMALTDKGFQERLNEITDVNAKPFWTKLVDMLIELLETMGFNINPDSLLPAAIEESLNLIKSNNKESDVTSTQPVSEINSPSEFTNHSGGAKGGDTAWDKIGREYRVVKHNHYREPGATELDSPELKGVKPVNLSQKDYDEGQKKVTIAARQMGRIAPTHQVRSNYMIRNWAQVKYSDAVYAVGTIIDKDSVMNHGKIAKIPQVKGGTGYAVQMAINEGKTVYVYDGTKDSWFEWVKEVHLDPETNSLLGGFVPANTPTLTKNFAGIGSRSLSSTEVWKKSDQAIRDVYKKTFSQPANEVIKSNLISTPKIEVVNRYTSADLKANPDKIYVFGDNTQRKGTGGQAQIRNNENAFGIATKLQPNNNASAFMSDNDLQSNKNVIDSDIAKIKADGRSLVFPKDGFGTGLAKLKEKAPQTYTYLKQRLQEEFGFNNDTGAISTQPSTQPSNETNPEVKENKFTYKNRTIDTDFTLTEGQDKALTRLAEFVENSNSKKAITLQGAAGTGKTAVIGYLQKLLPNTTFVYLAPTHAATTELASATVKAGNKELPMTIASAIGESKNRITGVKESVLRKKLTDKFGYSDNIMVIDEVSMLSNKDYKILQDAIKNYNVKVIFMGDILQIPEVDVSNPVVKQVSKSFSTPEQILLTEVKRTDDDKILQLLTELRKNTNGKIPRLENSNKLKYLASTEFNNLLVETFKAEPEESTLISYTNKGVTASNLRIRKTLGRVGDLIPGDIIVGYAGYNSKQIEKQNIANSMKYTITKTEKIGSAYSIEATSKKLEELEKLGIKKVSKYASGKYLQLSENDSFIFDELNEEDFQNNNKEISNVMSKLHSAKQAALANNRMWGAYYSAVESTSKYFENTLIGGDYIYNPSTKKMEKYNYLIHKGIANELRVSKAIDFGHAVTIHKAQGSTIKNVFFETDTLPRGNSSILKQDAKIIGSEKHSLIYVALSRASKLLVINTSNPEHFSSPTFKPTSIKPLNLERLNEIKKNDNTPTNLGADDLISVQDMEFERQFEEFLLTC